MLTPGALSTCDVADYSAGDERAPMCVAVELENEPGVFECPAYAPGLYSLGQLQAWAERVACVLLIVRWEKREIYGSV